MTIFGYENIYLHKDYNYILCKIVYEIFKQDTKFTSFSIFLQETISFYLTVKCIPSRLVINTLLLKINFSPIMESNFQNSTFIL